MAVVFVRELSLKYRGPRRGVTFDAVGSPVKAAEFMRRVLPDNVREHFLTLFLDNRNQVMGYYVAATGTASSCPVGAKEVFQAALAAGATSIIVGHNHTSGQNAGGIIPSAEDVAVTHRLQEAGELLGIPVLDHLVIGNAGFYSFQEHDEMRLRKP
jgi:DNA repair protein RadC